jgi:hypothetical protein
MNVRALGPGDDGAVAAAQHLSDGPSDNGARFVHDRLELAGWQVEIADAQKVKGLAVSAENSVISGPGPRV